MRQRNNLAKKKKPKLNYPVRMQELIDDLGICSSKILDLVNLLRSTIKYPLLNQRTQGAKYGRYSAMLKIYTTYLWFSAIWIFLLILLDLNVDFIGHPKNLFFPRILADLYFDYRECLIHNRRQFNFPDRTQFVKRLRSERSSSSKAPQGELHRTSMTNYQKIQSFYTSVEENFLFCSFID